MTMATEAVLDLAAEPTTKVRLPRYVIPAVLGLVLFIIVAQQGSALLRDPDSQWHVAIGRWIVAHGAVPTVDLFSYTYAGKPWIAKEWVSQLILYFTYESAGWRGEVALTALVAAGSFAALFTWLCRRMRVLAALTLTLGAFGLVELHMLVRPHMLVIPVIVGWMIALVSAVERKSAPPLPATLLVVAWANMHGSFPFGLIMAGVLAGEGVLLAPDGCRFALARRWATFLALSAAATMISPFGWRAILVPLMMFGNGETLSFVNEWRPLEFDMVGLVAGYMLVATAAILLLDMRRNAFRLLAAALVAYLMIRHVRFVSLFGLIAPILAARTVALYMPPAAGGLWVSSGARKAILAGLGAMALAAVVLVVVRHPAPTADVMPQQAYDAAMAHGVKGNVYNDYDFGGFLIAHGVETFVDGRTDQLFLGSFLPDLKHAIDDKDDATFAGVVARNKIGWALIRPRSRVSAHFDRMAGWTRVFEDETSAAYVRD